MLFDTHAHLDDRRFDADRAALLARLPEPGDWAFDEPRL